MEEALDLSFDRLLTMRIYIHTYTYIYIYIYIYIAHQRETCRSVDIYTYIYVHIYIYKLASLSLLEKNGVGNM